MNIGSWQNGKYNIGAWQYQEEKEIIMSSSLHVYNSVITGNGSNGIYLISDRTPVVHNSIISNNGEHGIKNIAGSQTPGNGISHNCFFNNTSGDVSANINGGTIPGYGNITSDPQYFSARENKEDFRIENNSPCWDTGIGHKS